MRKILCMVCLIAFLSGCSLFNSRFLPKEDEISNATITVVEKDTDLNPENTVMRPVLYLDKGDATRLFSILKNSLYSINKASSADPVIYEVTFIGKDKNKLLTLDLKGESSGLVLKPDGTKVGEYEISNEFNREIQTQVKKNDL